MTDQQWVEYRGPVPVRHVVKRPRKHGECWAVLGEAINLSVAKDHYLKTRCPGCGRRVHRISFPVRIAPGSRDWDWAQDRMAEAQGAKGSG